jgi:hypothetical protein
MNPLVSHDSPGGDVLAFFSGEQEDAGRVQES